MDKKSEIVTVEVEIIDKNDPCFGKRGILVSENTYGQIEVNFGFPDATGTYLKKQVKIV